MRLNIESFEGKSGVYFITDASHSHVRIGESVNLKSRLMEHVSSRGKANTILLNFLECHNHLEIEKATHNYFSEYRLPDETNSFYSSEIIPFLKEFVLNKGLKISSQSQMIDLWGGKTSLKENRPRCFFFPEQTAAIMGKAGIDEVYRTYPYNGRRVPVSAKFHNFAMQLKREGKPSGANLSKFIDLDENKLERFFE